MTKATWGRSWHIVTFVVAVVALVLQLALILAGQNIIDASAAASRPEAVRRFLSYFTIQSNFLVAVATLFIIRGRTGSQVFRVVRLASLIGISVTGVVAAVALPPSPNYTTANLVCDRLLHIVVPVLTLVGWLVFGPRGFVRRADLLPTLIWPVVWLVATLGLGPVVSWYPYPFLNVATIGLGRALVNSAGVAVLFIVLAVVAWYADGRLPGARRDDAATLRA